MGGGQWLAKLERVASREALAQQVVECTALEIQRRCKPIEGSNPSLSASKSLKLNKKTCSPELYRHFRRLAAAVVGVGH